MEGDVLADETAHKEIPVVIAALHAEPQRIRGGQGRGLEKIGAQLRGEECVGISLIDQHGEFFDSRGDEQARIIRGPCTLIGPKVIAERLVAPRALRGCTDRREGTDRPEPARVAQGDGERPVPAHGVAADGLALHVEAGMGPEQRGQFAAHVVVHAVMRIPRRLRGVDVKPRAQTEVPGAVRISRYSIAARAGIGRKHGDAMFGRITLCTCLDDEVLVGAGEARQPDQQRNGTLLRLRRQV